MASHDTEVQRIFLRENVVAIKEEAKKGEVEGLKSHAEVNVMNVNKASKEDIFSQVRSARMFKKRAKKVRIET